MDSAEDITYFRERIEDLSEEITMLAAHLDSDIDETIFEIIEEQVERTRLHSSSGDSVPCSGRPSFDIPAESIEHLLLCGLKVRQLADLYGVSEKTITRQMSQFDIRRLQELKKEEETLLKVKALLQDQLNRLKVEELALRSIINEESGSLSPTEAAAEVSMQVDNENAINQTELQLDTVGAQQDMEEEEEDEDN
ncbi:SNPC5 protein, partial [Polypterus senegalus]